MSRVQEKLLNFLLTFQTELSSSSSGITLSEWIKKSVNTSVLEILGNDLHFCLLSSLQ